MANFRKTAITGFVVISVLAIIIYIFRYTLALLVLGAMTVIYLLGQDFRSYTGSYRHEGTANVGGINLRVGLAHAHPFLAEYKRYVYVDNGSRIYFGIDTGGFAYINVYDSTDKIILQTFAPSILLVDKKSKKYDLEERELSAKETEDFIGKFHFVERGRYGFSLKERSPNFSPAVMKGG